MLKPASSDGRCEDHAQSCVVHALGCTDGCGRFLWYRTYLITHSLAVDFGSLLLICIILWALQKRWLNDKVVNSSLVETLQGRMWIKVPWSDVAVGDIVRVGSQPHFSVGRYNQILWRWSWYRPVWRHQMHPVMVKRAWVLLRRRLKSFYLILQVVQDQYFPADLLLLASTNADGICYIEVKLLNPLGQYVSLRLVFLHGSRCFQVCAGADTGPSFESW